MNTHRKYPNNPGPAGRNGFGPAQRLLALTMVALLPLLFPLFASAQEGFGNQWIFGQFNTPQPSGALLDFNSAPPELHNFDKSMKLEGACAVMCDSSGKLLFYSNGCYIANAAHEMMVNGDSIGKGKLESSFCKTGGNPLVQGIIALPAPGSDHVFHLFYTDIEEPYTPQPEFFPLAPVTLYMATIDMSLENGRGAVVEKNRIVVQDTLCRGMIQAARHTDGEKWWVFMPESHSNCYWTILLGPTGIDTVFKQCLGAVWLDNDPQGQAVFSPDEKKYARINYFYGLNIFDFDAGSGMFSHPAIVDFGLDTFIISGAAFSSNSRFLYTSCNTKLWRFDLRSGDISGSRTLIAELQTPPEIPDKTRFNQARLAPDGKIYIAGRTANRHLHVINRPNCPGQDCDFKQYAVELMISNGNALPNMPQYKTWNTGDSCIASATTIPNSIFTLQLFPNPAHERFSIQGMESGDELQGTDLFGRQQLLQPTASNTFDVSTWPPGFYLLKLKRQGNVQRIFKLIKN